MKTKLTLAVGVILLLAAVSAFAHHPFSAEYDWKKPVTLTGTVSKFEWANPHSVLYIDAKDASGGSLGNPIEGGAILGREAVSPVQEGAHAGHQPLQAARLVHRLELSI